MERADAGGGSAWRWLCLERQHLSKLVQGCLRDHRDALEWTEILRPARQTSEGVLTMKTGSTKVVRCAIYTRVSTDQGLEQDFNSLDAQDEASQAYIRSQAHAGWTLLRAKYDDGGFSGGPTDRPALHRASLARAVRRDLRDRRLQGRPPDPLVGGFREARRAIRQPQRVLRLGYPAVQQHNLDGPAYPEGAAGVLP